MAKFDFCEYCTINSSHHNSHISSLIPIKEACLAGKINPVLLIPAG